MPISSRPFWYLEVYPAISKEYGQFHMAPERIVLSLEKLARAVGDRWSEEELEGALALLSRADGRFPAGVRTLPQELIRAVQRERLLAAMILAVTEVGYASLTVQHVLTRAGVSRPTFYEQFEDKEKCFLAALDSASADLRGRIESAVTDSDGGWRPRLRAGIGATLSYAAAEPESARALIVEARSSSAAGLRRHDRAIDAYTTELDEMVRAELGTMPRQIASQGVVGGIESVLYSQLLQDRAGELPSLLPQLTYFAVLAYGDRDEALEELASEAG